MILLDTHAWVWWAEGMGDLSSDAIIAIEAEPIVGICAITCWEVAMLADKGRLEQMRVPVEQWVNDALALPGVQLVPLSASAAIMAGLNPMGLHRDPADRMIAATAITQSCALVTKDKRLRECSALTTIW